LPHPDSYARDLLQELRAAVEAFKVEHRGHQPLAAVAKAFKRAASVLEQCAPLSGKREFLVSQRVVLCKLQKRQDLNGCVAIIRNKADENDGRIEVCVGMGSKKEMMRIKPANLRLDWHVAADFHESACNSNVLVRRMDSAFCDQVCQVVSGNLETWEVTVRGMSSVSAIDEAAPVDLTEVMPSSDLVPAVYIDIANDVSNHTVTIVLLASGVSATPAAKAMMSAAHSCAEFHIRCARGREAARVCVSVMEAVHSGGKSGVTPSSRMQDYFERLAWISKFLSICLDHVDVNCKREDVTMMLVLF
jgi:hypothetical protein